MAWSSAGEVRGRVDRTEGPVVAGCEIVVRRREGAYWLMTMAAPEIARRAHPGQFVSIAVGEPGTLLRRPFSIAKVTRRGAVAGTVDVVFDEHGPGTSWLARTRLHDTLDVVGPLGQGFPLPQRKVTCLLVGGGYGVAPLYFLARELQDRGLRVDMLIGAATAGRLHDTIEAKSLSVSATFTTEDGTYGHRGRVTDVLDETLDRTGAGVVYACGPNGMLRAVSEACVQRNVPVQVALEERMACGTGVCFTCVVPMRERDGSIVNRRSCTEGPVVNGAKIAWDLTPYGAAAATPTKEHIAIAPTPPVVMPQPAGTPKREPNAPEESVTTPPPPTPAQAPDPSPAAPKRRGVLGRFATGAAGDADDTAASDERGEESRP